MKLIYFIAKQSKVSILWALVAGVLSGVCTSGLLAVINAALGGKQQGTILITLFVLLALAAPIARVLAEFLLVHLGQNTLAVLRIELSKLTLSQPLRRLEELGPHRLLGILLDDIPNITFFMSAVPLLCVNSAVVLACLGYMSWLSPRLFAVMCVFLVIGVGSYLLPLNRASRHFRHARGEHDALQKHFNALISGTKELKLSQKRRAAFLDEVLGQSAIQIKELNIAGLKVYTIASSWGQLLVFVVIGLLIFVGSHSLENHDALTGFALCLLYLVGPLQMIMNSTPMIGRTRAAVHNLERLNLELIETVEQADDRQPAPQEGLWQGLELIDVTYRYTGQGGADFALGPINLTISPGEILFLAGGNGSGKTTLAKLICGLYTPSTGEIWLNGSPVTEKMADQYRQIFSAVFSDFHLFDALLGFSAGEVDEKARHYLQRLALDNKVCLSDGRFSTIELSQGQRKRLALLIAYLEDRPIYLFDEWAADQDPRFKEVFYRELLPDLKRNGKTVILISHDERFYCTGDRVVTLESGNVVADTQVTSLLPVYGQVTHPSTPV